MPDNEYQSPLEPGPEWSGLKLTERENKELEATIAQFIEQYNELTRTILEQAPSTPEPVIPQLSAHPTEEEREKYRIAKIAHTAWTEGASDEYKTAKADLESTRLAMAEALSKFRIKAENAPKVKGRFPQQHIAPTDQITDALFKGELTATPQEIQVNSRSKKKPVTVAASASINYEALDVESIQRIMQNLGEYDRAVYNAVVSLYNRGNKYISTEMIYQAMTGNKNAKPNEHAKKIEQSIITMMGIVANIDSSNEQKMNGRGDVQITYRGNLIYAKEIVAVMSGQRIDDCFFIMDTPLLYQYASAKNQVTTSDITLLNAPINKSPDNIALISYLKRRILYMPDPKTNNRIRYATLYEQAGADSGTSNTVKSRRRRIKEYTKTILDYWKECGFIDDYAEYTKPDHQHAEGIQITPKSQSAALPEQTNPQRGE